MGVAAGPKPINSTVFDDVIRYFDPRNPVCNKRIEVQHTAGFDSYYLYDLFDQTLVNQVASSQYGAAPKRTAVGWDRDGTEQYFINENGYLYIMGLDEGSASKPFSNNSSANFFYSTHYSVNNNFPNDTIQLEFQKGEGASFVIWFNPHDASDNDAGASGTTGKPWVLMQRSSSLTTGHQDDNGLQLITATYGSGAYTSTDRQTTNYSLMFNGHTSVASNNTAIQQSQVVDATWPTGLTPASNNVDGYELIQPDKWHCLIITGEPDTPNQTSNQLHSVKWRIYLNGNRIGLPLTQTSLSDPFRYSAKEDVLTNSAHGLNVPFDTFEVVGLGDKNYEANRTSFHGKIGVHGFFDRMLSDAEAQSVYESQRPWYAYNETYNV